MAIVQARRMGEVRAAIREVEQYAKDLAAKTGKKIYHLNIGDPDAFDFDTPEEIKKALYDATEKRQNGYAESLGEPDLRQAIIEHERKFSGIKADDVVVTSGLSEAILFIFGALLNPGDRVLVPSPTYPQYPSTVRLFDGTPVFYDCVEEDNWHPDTDQIRKAADKKTKAIVLINPNNPTGCVYDRKILHEIADIAAEHELLVISDEIYNKITFDRQHVPLAPLAKDAPVLTLNGLSKAYLAPGWRLGWIIFSDPAQRMSDFREGIHKLCRLRLCANHPCQHATAAALRGSHDHLKGVVKKLRERRDFVYKRCNEIPGLSLTKPDGAFYAFPRIDGPWKDDREFVMDLVNETGVLFVHGSGFSAKGKHFRTVLLPPVETLEKVFDLVEGFMRAKR